MDAPASEPVALPFNGMAMEPVYDAGREKRAFVPIDPHNVRMYVRLTVYDFAHIGNARPVIVFDVLFRLLRHAK
jgi:cysteinyl-tRNA synthetase